MSTALASSSFHIRRIAAILSRWMLLAMKTVCIDIRRTEVLP